MANTKEGWVEEHMGGSKWAKSYIVLQSNFLLLFSKPPGGLHKPRTKVDVTTCYVLRKDDFRQNTFALSPKDKNKKAYFFAAPDRQTAEQWMDAIKTQQTPIPTPSATGPADNPYMPRKTSNDGPAHNPYMPRKASSSSDAAAASSSPSAPAASPLPHRLSSPHSSPAAHHHQQQQQQHTSSASSPSPSVAADFSTPAPQSMYPSPVMSSHSAPMAAVPTVGGAGGGGGSSYYAPPPPVGGGYHSGPAPYVGAPPPHSQPMPVYYQQQQHPSPPPQQQHAYYQPTAPYAHPLHQQHQLQPAVGYGGVPPGSYHHQAPPHPHSLAAYPQHHSSPALFGVYHHPPPGAPAAAAPATTAYYAGAPGPAYPTQAAPPHY